MLQKHSLIYPIDKSGVWQVKIFHIFKGSYTKTVSTGGFVKVSVKINKPNSWSKKGEKLKGIINFTKYNLKRGDGINYFFKSNTCVTLKKRLTPRGKELFGPSLFLIKRKKFINSFSAVL